MSKIPVILVSDHRGSGLANHLSGWAQDEASLGFSASLLESSRSLAQRAPDLLILDPLTRRGTSEVRELLSIPTAPPALLLVSDADAPNQGALSAAELVGVPVDIIRRDASPSEFQARSKRLLQRLGERAELELLRYEASHDDRTGLLRAVPFQRRIEEHFSAATRHGFPLTLVVMDLDRFGQINKEYNHTVGDEIIAAVGRLVRENLRTEDVGGRLGGDEFGLLLPYTSAVDCARVVRRIRDRLRLILIPVEGMPAASVTGSLGFESFDGTDLPSDEDLRLRAERALRAAKLAGGDCGVYFKSLPISGLERA